MFRRQSRRVLAGLLASIAATVSAVPAQAAPGAGLDIRFKDIVLAPGSGDYIAYTLTSSRPTEVTGASVEYQLSSNLGGVHFGADRDPASPCSQFPTTETYCKIDDVSVRPGPQGAVSAFMGTTYAAADMAPGTTGTVTATFEADGIAPITRTIPLRIGEPVDLATDPAVALSGRPGAAFSLPLTVRHTGATVADGAAVLLDAPRAFENAKQFSNCRYDGVRLTACSFDQHLQPGVSYRAVLPMRVRRDTYAPRFWTAEANWQTGTEFAALNAFRNLGRPGAGPALVLAPVAGAKALAGQADPDRGNNISQVTLKSLGTNGLNLVPVGARLTGKAGSTVVAKVGLRNAGPATLDLTNGGSLVLLAVAIPPGSSATSVPRSCAPLRNGEVDFWAGGELGHAEYWCSFSGLLTAGEAQNVAFALRITKVIANATGPIEINKAGSGWNRILFTGEAPKTDNKSSIVLNAPVSRPGGGESSGGGSDGGSGGTGGGTDGGGLPITGPRSLAYGGSGLLILLLGAGVLWLVRRRRTRFEA